MGSAAYCDVFSMIFYCVHSSCIVSGFTVMCCDVIRFAMCKVVRVSVIAFPMILTAHDLEMYGIHIEVSQRAQVSAKYGAVSKVMVVSVVTVTSTFVVAFLKL